MIDVTKPCRETKELSAQAQKACALFMEECKRQGLNVLITETYRSQARQNYLYEQGRSRSGNIVTWTKNSRHTSRRAWDICKNVRGAEYSDKAFFIKCGEIAALFGITWGGDWNSTPDTPHFEIDANWKEPTAEDVDLVNAVELLAKRNIISNTSMWDDISRMNMAYVPSLLSKMGGINRLLRDKIISDELLWTHGLYKPQHVRSLIIKYSKLA